MRFVWDRKNVATTKEKKALVQLELVFGRKKKYISTGIHLYKGEWDNVMWVKNRFDQEELNERLRNHYKRVYKACNEVCKKGEFTFEKLERELKRTSGSETFIEYVDRRIKERNDIKASTKKNHRKLVTMLHGYEKIVDFSDLTRGNINDFYNYLLGLNIRQLTVSSYVKNLKVYIHDAMAHDMIRTDPCAGMKFKRGESEEGRWLSVDELKKIEDLEDLGFLQTARDLFLLQCYMGVAYADQDGDMVTSIVRGKECVFARCTEDGCWLCMLEKVYRDKQKTNIQQPTDFIKPISCALYPIREKTFSNGTTGLNYNRWVICHDAVEKGKALHMRVYQFLKEPLIRRFGKEWYDELCEVARQFNL